MINMSLYAIFKSLPDGRMEVVTTKGLVYRRKSLNLTQAQLAKAIGVSVITICRWENGSQTPSIPMCRTLCEFFECSFDELLQDPACTSPPPEGGGSSAGVRGEPSAEWRRCAGVTDGAIMLDLVIRQEGAKAMNCATAMECEMRVELAIVGGRPRVEVCGRTSPGASAEDVAKLFDELKAGAMAALGSLKPDAGAEGGSTE